MNNKKNNWFTTTFATVVPNRIDDDSPTTTKAKLWIAFGVGIWLIGVATSLVLGYGPSSQVNGIPIGVIWLLSGMFFIYLGITRVGLKQS